MEERLGRVWWLIALWTALVAASLYWNLHQARQTALKLASAEAHLSYNKDLAYRLWAVEHGGVYVFITPQTPPNPYLSFLKARDIKTPSGRTLTLVNHAYMISQVQELAGHLYGARAHLTSLKPISPESSPDPWEKKALEAFATGHIHEVQEVVTVAGEPILRLIRPWRIRKACLKCHASQDYKVGDIRGGLSVEVPLKPYFASVGAQTLPLAAGHCLIWVLGLTGIMLRERDIQRDLDERRQAADILRESKARLAEAQRIAHLGNWEWDIARNKSTLSDEVYRIFGLAPQEFQATYEDLLGFIHPDDLKAVKHHVDEGIRCGKFGPCDYRIIRRDGSIRFIYAHGETYFNQASQSLRMRGTLQDITELKQATESLRESEELFRQAFENTNIGMALVGIDGRYLRVNHAMSAMFGYSRAELEKMAVFDLIYLADLQVSKDFRLQSLRGEIGSAQFELRKIHRNGTIVWIHVASSLMRDSQGKPLYFVSQVQDITVRKRTEEALRQAHEELEQRVKERTEELRLTVSQLQAEATERQKAGEALRESEERFRALVTASSDVVYRMSPDWREMLQLRGRDFIPDTQTPSQTWLQKYIHPDDQPHVLAAINEAIRTKSVFELEHRIRRVDGSLGWTFSRAIPRLDQDGGIVEWFGAASDITARKLAEEALRESEQQLRYLASQIMAAQEKERKRIAMELHEGLGQSMSALKMYLRSIEQRLPSEAGRIKQEFSDAQNLIIEMIEEVRRISQGLSPVLLENLGITAALKHLLEDLRKYQEVTISEDIDDIRDLFSPQTEINLFRVFQEALHNIVKHAQATRISVTIKRHDDRVNFSIKDDGIGFDPQQIAARQKAGRGMGLAAMQERLRMIGARLKIVSQMGQGTEVSFSIHCDAKQRRRKH